MLAQPKIGGENFQFCPHLLGHVVATPIPNQFLRISFFCMDASFRGQPQIGLNIRVHSDDAKLANHKNIVTRKFEMFLTSFGHDSSVASAVFQNEQIMLRFD